MNLTTLLVFAGVALLLGLALREKTRTLSLLFASTLAIYAIQPALSVRGLDFWFPTITLALVTLGWVITTPAETRTWRANLPALLILAGTPFLLALTRYLGTDLPLTASRPPQTLPVLGLLLAAALIIYLTSRQTAAGPRALNIAFWGFVGILLLIKTPILAQTLSAGLRALNQQSITQASSFDIRWLGISYIAFRILHTLRDRESGRLPAASLAEYATYTLFFPALSAGPIDRLERFLADLRRPFRLDIPILTEGAQRLILGLFKKFVIADTLALVALNDANATQIHAASWGWVVLYAYALQIYFDFSGYTDIAIGMARWMGIKLPENFNAPYQKPDVTQFWNNWHMTLTQWFRAYFFNPVTRSLRAKKWGIPSIIFVTQMGTMLLIGLWHGVTANFVLWGTWHGLGLFLNNRWAEWAKPRLAEITPMQQNALNILGAIINFHFVALGWVFFALSTPALSFGYFKTLLGLP